jgi:hypothetical protein
MFQGYTSNLRPTQPPTQWVPGAFSSGVKQQGRQADHLPISSAKVKKGGAIPPLPHMSSRHSASLIKHRNTFTLQKIFNFKYSEASAYM